MGLISKEVEVGLSSSNINYYDNLGYLLPKIKNKIGKSVVPKGSKIIVNIKDLSNGSHANVDVECDGCGRELKNIKWQTYLKCVHNNDIYYCKKCAREIAGNNISKGRLKNSISFEQWCIDNNRQDALDRWDYNSNKLKPCEISYGTQKKYYFKCPKGIHKSELKNINSFTNGGSLIECNQCDSFAQRGINNLGNDFLEKYWDYEKNIVDPWEISYGNSYIVVYIKCQDKDYHDSYPILCNSFTYGQRCPYCSSKKVHPLDSLGTLYPQVLKIWSDKNKKSPYEYSSKSGQEVYWKCPEYIHNDYKRSIDNSHLCDFRCPECQYSKGEEKISNDLINRNFIKISQEDFKQLIDKYNKNYFIPQMKYNELTGIGGRLLSYDFYLPKLNLLIEYQGEFHDGTAYQQTEEDFLKQKEHDKRKKEYTKKNNIKLLEIWYWDFDRIETILSNILI